MSENNLQPVTYKPFSSRQRHVDWIHQNCDSCKKGFDRKRWAFRCSLELALALAAVNNGIVPAGIAKAIGMLENEGCDLWECPGWVKR
ncbi:hypothetical protein KA005_07595 [bacterium]|nr:hypothetical protein [bacterium]